MPTKWPVHRGGYILQMYSYSIPFEIHQLWPEDVQKCQMASTQLAHQWSVRDCTPQCFWNVKPSLLSHVPRNACMYIYIYISCAHACMCMWLWWELLITHSKVFHWWRMYGPSQWSHCGPAWMTLPCTQMWRWNLWALQTQAGHRHS